MALNSKAAERYLIRGWSSSPTISIADHMRVGVGQTTLPTFTTLNLDTEVAGVDVTTTSIVFNTSGLEVAVSFNITKLQANGNTLNGIKTQDASGNSHSVNKIIDINKTSSLGLTIVKRERYVN